MAKWGHHYLWKGAAEDLGCEKIMQPMISVGVIKINLSVMAKINRIILS